MMIPDGQACQGAQSPWKQSPGMSVRQFLYAAYQGSPTLSVGGTFHRLGSQTK